jgi:hypothetical protein
MFRFRQNMEERERELIKSGIGLERYYYYYYIITGKSRTKENTYKWVSV